ncbi:hypothetical protein IAR55_004945 [Kwoniella newhampshirensis]|uniref:Uncharacterized protein n=1 Tax=Kwoniella newhampshirensis TaxID=1651941 RepID=A0AAW0YIK4_9TREE
MSQCDSKEAGAFHQHQTPGPGRYAAARPVPYPEEASILPTDDLEPQTLLVLVGLPGSGKTTFAESLVRASNSASSSQPSSSSSSSWECALGTVSESNVNPTEPNLAPHGINSTTPGFVFNSNCQSESVVRRQQQQQQQQTRRRQRRIWIRASQDDAPSRRRQECESRVRWGLRQGYNVIVDRCGFDVVQRSHFINIAHSSFPLPRPRIHCLIFDVSNSTLEARLMARPSHPTIPDAETGLRVLRQMRAGFRPPTSHDGEGFDKIFTLTERDQSGGVGVDTEVGTGTGSRNAVTGTGTGIRLPDGRVTDGRADNVRWDEDHVWDVLNRIEEQGQGETKPGIIAHRPPVGISDDSQGRVRSGIHHEVVRGSVTWSGDQGRGHGQSHAYLTGTPIWSRGISDSRAGRGRGRGTASLHRGDRGTALWKRENN